MSEPIHVVHCGLIPYEEAHALQRRLRERRQRGEIADVLLLIQHPPVYTRGRRATPEELPMGVEWYEAQGIEVRDTERGGRVTYHGPGQLVAYPIVSLAPYGGDVLAYVRKLERAMIAAIGDFGIEAGPIEGETGVWVHGDGRPRKIGSIGLHISRGVTTHGLAVNVNNDLQPFEWVIPCGIDDCAVTSVSRELGAEQDFDAFATAITNRYCETFDREPRTTALAELDRERAPASLG